MSREFKPHDYQLDIIKFIQSNTRCLVMALMGTGKSVSTLVALDALSLVEDDIYPVLILAPLRVAKSTWPNEILKWSCLSHLRVSVVTGSAAEREAALKKPADIYTCNFDNLVWLVETTKGHWPFKTVVADESTRLKSFRLRQGAKRARALGSIAHTQIRRFIGLTGTPSPNGLVDLWGQLWFVDQGERLGRTFSAFEGRWFTKGYDGFSMKPLPSAQREIETKIADVCITVEGLPVNEPIFNPIYVDLPPDARKVYKEMETKLFIEIAEHGVEALNAASKTVKLSQIASGFAYLNEERDWSEIHKAKIEALESVIEEQAGAPLLVAYQFKADLERLKKAFPKAHVLDANPKTINDWNAGKIQILLAHPASAGHGLNLAEGGNVLCFFGIDWNLENHMQIIERIGPQRQAQAGLNRPVMIHYLLARDTVDDMVLDRLKSKRSVQDVLLAALRRSGYEPTTKQLTAIEPVG